MAIDYCYISVFVIVDRYTCASMLRDNSLCIVDNSESIRTYVPAASQRCSISHLLPLVYLVKHILLVTWLIHETVLVLSAYFKPVMEGDKGWEESGLAGQGHGGSRLWILTLYQSTEETALSTAPQNCVNPLIIDCSIPANIFYWKSLSELHCLWNRYTCLGTAAWGWLLHLPHCSPATYNRARQRILCMFMDLLWKDSCVLTLQLLHVSHKLLLGYLWAGNRMELPAQAGRFPHL